MLITKRRNDIKYEKNPEEVKNLRTDIRILEDAHMIKRSKKEVTKNEWCFFNNKYNSRK